MQNILLLSLELVLQVTNDRFQSNDAEDTTYPFHQGGEIGDEFHHPFKCTHFNESRDKYLYLTMHGISGGVVVRWGVGVWVCGLSES